MPILLGKLDFWPLPEIYWPIADRSVRVLKTVRRRRRSRIEVVDISVAARQQTKSPEDIATTSTRAMWNWASFGDPNNSSELRRRLREMDQDWQGAVRSAATRNDPRVLTFFQDPDGPEMWSRWDMQDDPPDILITNYSMLNIMLMRNVENNIFDSTRQWLQNDRGNLFHLVIDELHTYRGTPGTEVDRKSVV